MTVSQSLIDRSTATVGVDPMYRTNLTLHGVFGSIALAIIVMSFLMRCEGGSQVYMPGMTTPMPETCSTKMMFGMNCPGCGLTRGFIAISDGDLNRAWFFNPASWIVYAFVAIQIPWHAWQASRVVRGLKPVESNWFYLAPLLVGGAILSQWLWRLVP